MSNPPETFETVMAKCASTMDALCAGQIEPGQAQKIAAEVEQFIRDQRAELEQQFSTASV